MYKTDLSLSGLAMRLPIEKLDRRRMREMFSTNIWPADPSPVSFWIVFTEGYWYLEYFWHQYANSIYIHAHHALLAAIRERCGSALHGGELRTDKIVAEIEELLLAERVAGQADLNDGHRRGRINDD